MKKLSRILAAVAVLAAVSCVTINIYFPAEEVRSAADKIVNEVWGEKAGAPEPAAPTPPAEKQPGSSFLLPFGAAVAYAAQDIDVSTPEIRAIKDSIKERAASLIPYLKSGNVGIGRDGLLKVRSAEGLDLKARGEATRLVNAENADRGRLYAEIARANGFPDKVDEVKEIFAESWRQQAASGWYLEAGDGSWKAKP